MGLTEDSPELKPGFLPSLLIGQALNLIDNMRLRIPDNNLGRRAHKSWL